MIKVIESLKLHENTVISSDDFHHFTITRIINGFMYKYESYLLDENGGVDDFTTSTFKVSLDDFEAELNRLQESSKANDNYFLLPNGLYAKEDDLEKFGYKKELEGIYVLQDGYEIPTGPIKASDISDNLHYQYNQVAKLWNAQDSSKNKILLKNSIKALRDDIMDTCAYLENYPKESAKNFIPIR
ncbi:hypothetical protein [Winogradskyella sp.]|uniref:hypothetical protein n=1 Tax=Winogradskyella sp. TaxID=1883156 RepID=UPI00260AC115|nr:hypothetical protein [Winogradskyella sp.]